MKENTFVNEIRDYLIDKTLVNWINQANLINLRMFYTLLFDENETILKRIVPPSKNMSSIDAILLELNEMPYQSIKLSSKVITDILFKSIDSIENKEAKRRVNNIKWFVGNFKDSIDGRDTILKLNEENLNLDQYYYLINILSLIDKKEALSFIEFKKFVKEDQRFFLLYLYLLNYVNPKQSLDEFLKCEFQESDFEKTKKSLYLKLRKSLQKIVYNDNDAMIIVQKMNNLRVGSWKKQFLHSILEESKDLRSLLDKVNKPVSLAGNYQVYYDYLYREFEVFMNSNKNTEALLEHRFFDWKMISEVIINKIRFTNLKDSIKVYSLLNTIIEEAHPSNFNQFIMDRFDADYNPIENQISFKNHHSPIYLIEPKFKKKSDQFAAYIDDINSVTELSGRELVNVRREEKVIFI